MCLDTDTKRDKEENNCLYLCLRRAFRGHLPTAIDSGFKVKAIIFGWKKEDWKKPISKRRPFLSKLEQKADMRLTVVCNKDKKTVLRESSNPKGRHTITLYYEKQHWFWYGNKFYMSLDKNLVTGCIFKTQPKLVIAAEARSVYYYCKASSKNDSVGCEGEFFDWGMDKGKSLKSKFPGVPIDFIDDKDVLGDIKQYIVARANNYFKCKLAIQNICKYIINTKERYERADVPVIMINRGNKIANTALFYFAWFNAKVKDTFEPIQKLESFWIKKAYQGGLIYAEPGLYENAVCYDANKLYTYLMGHDSLWVPFKEGVSMRFESVEDIYEKGKIKCGIYHCEITPEHKFFRSNSANHYTHWDIKLAKQLGLKVTMLTKLKHNAMVYPLDTRIKASALFKPYMDYLTEINSYVTDPDIKKMVKELGNCLHGKLCQKTRKDKVPFKLLHKYSADDGWDVRGVGEDEYGTEWANLENDDNYYKYNYARLGPFLTSFARYYMITGKIKLQNLEHVVRIHTDGFITTQEMPEYAEGLVNVPGSMKIEKTKSGMLKKGRVLIENVNKLYWNDEIPK